MCLLTALETGKHCHARRQLCGWPSPSPTPRPRPRAQMWEQTVPSSQGGKPNEFSLPTPLCVLPTVLAKLFGNWLGLWSWPNQRENVS